MIYRAESPIVFQNSYNPLIVLENRAFLFVVLENRKISRMIVFVLENCGKLQRSGSAVAEKSIFEKLFLFWFPLEDLRQISKQNILY